MKFLANEKLSEHRYKTPEGYLVCLDSILARTGKQEYMKKEVYADSVDDESIIEVDRKPEQVFNENTLASYENKPITVEHPNEDVNSENYKDYSVGFARDIRQSKVDGKDVMVGNLIITDAQTIEEIENGEHCELSCGYDCEVTKSDNPEQINIRGNHIALCEHGRAGITRIVDSIDKQEFRLAKKKNDYDEYVIKAYINGKYDENATYYTDDWEDAVATLNEMAKRAHLTVKKTGSGFIADSDRIKDERIDDIDKQYKMCKDDAFNNGKLKDFKIEDLIKLVKERQEAVNSIRIDNKGNRYHIIIGGSFDTDLTTGKNISLDVISEDKDGNQKRVIMISKASSWQEIIDKFNTWKNTIKDSKIGDAKNISSDEFGNARIFINSLEDLERDAQYGEKVYLEQTFGGKTHGFWMSANKILKLIKTNKAHLYDSTIKDFSGMRENGIIYVYKDGYYYITHKNGKVEKIPGDKFKKIEELYEYVDKIKDSKIEDENVEFAGYIITVEKDDGKFGDVYIKHNGQTIYFKTVEEAKEFIKSHISDAKDETTEEELETKVKQKVAKYNTLMNNGDVDEAKKIKDEIKNIYELAKSNKFKTVMDGCESFLSVVKDSLPKQSNLKSILKAIQIVKKYKK